MTTLKELVDSDRASVFMSSDDFAEEHAIEGQPVTCVLDSDLFSKRSPELGVESGDIRLFALAEDIAPRREAGDIMDVDGRIYTVVSWQEDMGMAQVQLSSARANY